MSQQLQELSPSNDQAQAIANLPPSLAIIKMENDSIMSMAAARPRSMLAIKKDVQETLDAFPAMAEEAIYTKPVGKGDDGKQKYARNLSVRSAEALSEAYGFNRVRADVTPIPGSDAYKIEATFTDYQRSRIWQDSAIVSPWYKSRNGQMVKTPEDRFLGVTLKAEKAKLVREVILRSVNAGLKAWYWDAVEKCLATILDDGTIDRIVGQFATKGVTLQDLEGFVGRPRSTGWTKEDRADLLGIWNAIKDGETTVAEAFGREDPNKPGNGSKQPPSQNGGVQGSDLANAKTKEEAKPTATTPTPPADKAATPAPTAPVNNQPIAETPVSNPPAPTTAQTTTESAPTTPPAQPTNGKTAEAAPSTQPGAEPGKNVGQQMFEKLMRIMKAATTPAEMSEIANEMSREEELLAPFHKELLATYQAEHQRIQQATVAKSAKPSSGRRSRGEF